ncbi:MAG: hypothetical protein QOJ11_556 [Frankiales bacterium]|nr:hypothetical protein [Frankiales bacterium]
MRSDWVRARHTLRASDILQSGIVVATEPHERRWMWQTDALRVSDDRGQHIPGRPLREHGRRDPNTAACKATAPIPG